MTRINADQAASEIRAIREIRGQKNRSETRRVATMKTTSRRIWGVLLCLCVLSATMRGAGAEEPGDWMAEMRRQNDEFNRQAAADREAMDKFNREAQAERDARDKWNQQAQADREAMDKFNRDAQEDRAARDKWNQQVQADREATDKWNQEVQQWRDNEQKQK